MAINFGLTNTTRYYSGANSSDYAFGSGEFTVLASTRVQIDNGNYQYFFGCGDIDANKDFVFYTDNQGTTARLGNATIGSIAVLGHVANNIPAIYDLSKNSTIMSIGISAAFTAHYKNLLDLNFNAPQDYLLAITRNSSNLLLTHWLPIHSNLMYLQHHGSLSDSATSSHIVIGDRLKTYGGSNEGNRTVRLNNSISWLAFLKGRCLTWEELGDIANRRQYLMDDFGDDVTTLYDLRAADSTITDKISGTNTINRHGSGWGSYADKLPYSRDYGGRGIRLDLIKNDKTPRGSVSDVQATITQVDNNGVLDIESSITLQGISIIDGEIKIPYDLNRDIDEVHLVLYKSSEDEPEDDLIFTGRVGIISDINNP